MNKQMMTAFALALSAAAGLVGCMPIGGTEGELGHGEFFYECIGAGDAACSKAEEAKLVISISTADGSKMPREVAKNAPFSVIFQGNKTAAEDADGAEIGVTVAPASPALVADNSSDFEITDAATVSFLATKADGTVVDFIDVTAEAVDSVHVFHAGAAITSLSLPKNEIANIIAIPIGASGTPLAGGLSWAWQTSDPKVATVGPPHWDSTSKQQDNEVGIRAIGPGKAKVSVAVEGKRIDLDVDVAD